MIPTLKIEVTQADIDKGTSRSCVLCPVALAVKRMFPGRNVYVAIGRIEVESETEVWSEPMSIGVRDFIHDFDFGNPVKPFSFPLALRLRPSYFTLNPPPV